MLMTRSVNSCARRFGVVGLFPRVWVAGVLLLFSSGASAKQENCPDWTANGQIVKYTATELDNAKTHVAAAGGEIDLTKCSSVPGNGFVSRKPDFTLEYSGGGGSFALEFRVNSECDSVLLVNGPDRKWHFDDDSNGNDDAKLRIPGASNGVYDIWVGKVGGGTCKASLHLETFGTGGASATGGDRCPNPAENGVELTFSAQELLSPKQYSVSPGEEINLDDCSSVPGTGFLTRKPSFTLHYKGGSEALEFRVESNCDSTLLINGPNQQWFFDDDSRGDSDPKKRFENASSGTYDIWVGKTRKGPCSARLFIETFK